jgi:phage terminase large subunit GpA-like protein
MHSLLSLSRDGQHFICRCRHCGTERQERVSPALNPYPFSYLPACSGCHQPISVDHQQTHAIQQSYLRATGAKKCPPLGEVGGGRKGGDVLHAGSPAYSAISATRAETDLVAGAGLEPATSWL